MMEMAIQGRLLESQGISADLGLPHDRDGLEGGFCALGGYITV